MSRGSLARWSAAAGVSVFATAVLAGSAAPSGAATSTIRVEARDFSFKLSRRSAPAGSTVRFAVRNRGKASHRFVLNGKRTRSLARGQSQTITVEFPHRGSFRFLCTVANHARKGMRGTFSVTAATPAPEPPSPVTGSAVLARIGTFERPVFATAPLGDDRVFVVEQTGAIRVVRDGQTLPRPFLDLRGQVNVTNESGLLSMAFAPDYAQSGLFYVFYNTTAGSGDIRIAEYGRRGDDPDVADPSSDRTVLTITKPWENHNGGMLQFGPDGYLYVSVGDGDSGVVHPPGYFAQRRDVLLGSILRIDPRGGPPYSVPTDNPFVGLDDALPEVWAYGLRNPWRFWIDHQTGVMFIGDPGQERREEVNLVGPGEAGANFGWPCLEGTLSFDLTAICDQAVPPLVEIPRDNGVCAVIGGVVARDTRLSALAGRYLYGDLCLGRITAIAVENGRVVASDDLGVEVARLTSFGIDGTGRIHVMSHRGDVYRLDPKPSS